MTELPPMAPELRDLLASERDVSAADRAAIRHKLEASVGTAAPSTSSALGGKAALLAVAGLFTATAIWWAAQHEHTPAPPAPQAPAIASSAEIEIEGSAAAREPAPPPAPPVAQPPSAQAKVARSPSQAELLAQAWQALGRRDAARCLQILADDRRLHPTGALAEEREAMHVQALAAAGRRDDARAAARTFLARYPRSVHRNAIEEALR